MKKIKMTYPNGQVIVVDMNDAEINKLVEDCKNGCLIVSRFELLD